MTKKFFGNINDISARYGTIVTRIEFLIWKIREQLLPFGVQYSMLNFFSDYVFFILRVYTSSNYVLFFTSWKLLENVLCVFSFCLWSSKHFYWPSKRSAKLIYSFRGTKEPPNNLRGSHNLNALQQKNVLFFQSWTLLFKENFVWGAHFGAAILVLQS